MKRIPSLSGLKSRLRGNSASKADPIPEQHANTDRGPNPDRFVIKSGKEDSGEHKPKKSLFKVIKNKIKNAGGDSTKKLPPLASSKPPTGN